MVRLGTIPLHQEHIERLGKVRQNAIVLISEAETAYLIMAAKSCKAPFFDCLAGRA